MFKHSSTLFGCRPTSLLTNSPHPPKINNKTCERCWKWSQLYTRIFFNYLFVLFLLISPKEAPCSTLAWKWDPMGVNRGTTNFQGGTYYQMSPPPTILGLYDHWNEDPFLCELSACVDLPPPPPPPYQRGWWCTMGTPTLCLENWPKNCEVGEKTCRSPPPPPPPAHQLFSDLCNFRGWRVPPPPLPCMCLVISIFIIIVILSKNIMSYHHGNGALFNNCIMSKKLNCTECDFQQSW